MIKVDNKTKDLLIQLHKTKKISLEGNILKVIDTDGDELFEKYIKSCVDKDMTTRKKRLEITKQIQKQNNELITWKEENIRIQEELIHSLKENECAKNEAESARFEAENLKIEAENAREESEIARREAENARASVENDLELLQKKSQFELIGSIVKVALWIIISVGIITTGVFIISLLTNRDTAIVGSTWSNIVGILLTNAFSIVGTIMGVKYASEKNN